MNWVFPIAGYGTRTSTLGKYKPLIEIFPNYSILKLCLVGLKSLIRPADRLVFIASRRQELEYFVTQNIKKILDELSLNNKIDVIILNETPAGQALTIKNGIKDLGSRFLQDKIFIINSDQLVFFDLENVDLDNCSVGLYFNDASSSCFFDLDIENKLIKKIKEKKKISCYASAGVFYFSSGDKALECINWGIEKKKYHNNELYLGPCMEYFKNLSYFQTLVKFDLGNTKKIELFKAFIKNLVGMENEK